MLEIRLTFTGLYLRIYGFDELFLGFFPKSLRVFVLSGNFLVIKANTNYNPIL